MLVNGASGEKYSLNPTVQIKKVILSDNKFYMWYSVVFYNDFVPNMWCIITQGNGGLLYSTIVYMR